MDGIVRTISPSIKGLIHKIRDQEHGQVFNKLAVNVNPLKNDKYNLI